MIQSATEIREGAQVRRMIREAVRRVILRQRTAAVGREFVDLVQADLDAEFDSVAKCRAKDWKAEAKAQKKGGGKKKGGDQ